MGQKSRFVCVMLVWLAFGSLAWGASVTTRDGNTVVGEISGRIAFKSQYAEVEQEGHKYGVYFYLIADGASITEVTAEGVKLKGGDATLLLISWDLTGKGKAPSDTEALRGEHIATSPYGIAFGWLKQSGADVCRVNLGISKPSSINEVFAGIKGWLRGSSPAFLASPKLGSILGEWKGWKAGNLTPTEEKQLASVFEESKAGDLTLSLTIQQADGPKKLPVEQIVEFK